jgi:hypothetical protein
MKRRFRLLPGAIAGPERLAFACDNGSRPALERGRTPAV